MSLKILLECHFCSYILSCLNLCDRVFSPMTSVGRVELTNPIRNPFPELPPSRVHRCTPDPRMDLVSGCPSAGLGVSARAHHWPPFSKLRQNCLFPDACPSALRASCPRHRGLVERTVHESGAQGSRSRQAVDKSQNPGEGVLRTGPRVPICTMKQ